MIHGKVFIVRLIGLFFLLAALLVGCGPANEGKKGGKIQVVTTIGMINDAVLNVGGDQVEAIGLMGPGIDPHLYRATAGDVQKLERADVIFYGGLELEGRMTDIFVKMSGKGTATYPVGASIPETELREPPEFQGKFDPHVWFDVILWKHAVETIRDGLVKLRPESKDVFEKNAADYLKKLDDLHKYAMDQVATVPKESRVLVTAHDAFGYFGARYGFDVIGIQGTSTASEAAVSSIRNIADTIAKRKVKAIFVESSVPHATVEALQKAVLSRGWNVKIGGELFSDAMGKAGTPEGTYIGMVRHNVDTIVKALK